MTTATILNISEKIIPSKTYEAEELLGLLMKVVDYKVDFEEFSDEENNELMNKSQVNKISELID